MTWEGERGGFFFALVLPLAVFEIEFFFDRFPYFKVFCHQSF